MILSHIILGVTLIGFAIWLQWTERRGWPNESFDGEVDAIYFERRMRWRRRVNVIIGLCGVLILAANAAGPRLFVLAWMLVISGLLAVVVMAGFDAIRTQRYVNTKIPEIRRRILDGDSDPDHHEEDG
jgi:hypothetical protein